MNQKESRVAYAINNLSEEAEYLDLIDLKAIRGCKDSRDALLEEFKLIEFRIRMEVLLCLGRGDSEKLTSLKHEKSLLRDEILKLSIIPS